MLDIREDGATRSKNTVAPEIGAEDRADAPMQIFGKKFPKYWWTSHLVQFPTVYCAIFSFIPLILCILAISINTSVDRGTKSFSIYSHPSAQKMRTVENAQTEWREAYDNSLISSASSSANAVHRAQPKYRIYVNYEANVDKVRGMFGDDMNQSRVTDLLNLLQPGSLSYIHAFEKGIVTMNDFREMCWNSPFRGGDFDSTSIQSPTCSPLSSLMTYFFIGYRQNHSGVQYWDFDGVSGEMQVPRERVLDRIWVNPRHRWFMDQDASASNRRTRLLRTQITLGWPLPTPGTSEALSLEKYEDKADRLVLKLIEYFSDPPSSSFIDITYGGDRIQEALILRALANDSIFVLLGLVVVFFVLWYHFHSVILALIALLQIFLTYPSSFYLYTVISGADQVSLLTVLTFYFTLVMTLDGMMITFDTFKHSGFMPTSGRVNTLSVEQRVAYVYRKAGVGVGVSCIIALICFAINTTSPVPAISGFSGLMVVLVLLNAYMMLLVFPAAMLFHHFHISKRRRNLQRQKEILVDRAERHRYTPQQLFHKEVEEFMASVEQPTYEMVLQFMEGEANGEQAERDARSGMLGFLGVQNPVRFPNPFPVKSAVVPEYTPTEQAEEQGFVDQFPDAVPDGKGGVVLKGDSAAAPPSKRCLGTSEVIQISNYNIDEMLGFDDTLLRHKLHETGHSAADEFNREELIALSPGFGISSLGKTADERVTTVARTAIYIIFGVARTLNGACYEDTNPDAGGKRRKKKRGPNAAGAPNRAAGTAAPAVVGSSAKHGETQEPERNEEGQQAPKKKHRFKVTKNISDWWTDRKTTERKWCCGMVGQRINETPQQREERILRKKVKREGFSPLERFFFNIWAPMLQRLRWPILVLLVAIFITAAVLASFLVPASISPQFLGDNPSDVYDAVAARFGEEGSCDYCSAYFRPTADFPNPTRAALRACAFVYNIQLMHAEVDQCGVCFGENTCLDCAGNPNGASKYDSCGQCLNTTDLRWDSCLSCAVSEVNDMSCAECYTDGGSALGFGGKSCTNYCRSDGQANCKALGGKCNKYTGECDCHHDAQNGYWMNDPLETNASMSSLSHRYCTICLTGFWGLNCNLECNPTINQHAVAPCSCGTSMTCSGCTSGMFGGVCSARNKTYCDHGSLSPTGVCTCDSGWNGNSCQLADLCSSRGVLYNASQVYGTDFQCKCSGQFTGHNCSYCGCFNGGTCDSQGKCSCLGAWAGNDCSVCNSTCKNSTSGECPFPLPLTSYSTEGCRGLFCTEEELRTGNVTTSECLACNPPATTCDQATSYVLCGAPCSWDTFRNKCAYLRPAATTIPAQYTTCRCKGSFTGDDCSTCPSPHPDVNCTTQGVLVGCDDLPADSTGSFKVYDMCGNCGGSTDCFGCDGIPGSRKVLDSCGVCGGDDACLSATETTARINIAYGLNFDDGSFDPTFDLSNGELQSHILFICAQLNGRSDIIKPSQSKCIWADFVIWMQSVTAWTAMGYTMAFPFKDPRVNHAFYHYARANGRLTEAGFTGTDPGAADFKTVWIQLHLRSAAVPTDGNIWMLSRHYQFWRDNVMKKIINLARETDLPLPFMASDTWTSLFTQLVAVKGTVFSVSFGCIIFIAIMLPLTCSPVITLVSGTILISSILTVMGIFYIAGWTLGPVEQVVLSLLLGGCAGQVVQTAEGYLEYLHSAQSHIFAKETSQLQAVKGMFQRTGVSIFTSGCTLILCSCLLFACELLIFRRIAGIVIIITFTLMLHTMVLMGGVLCIVGPTESFRKPRVMALFAAGSLICALVLMLILGFTGAVSATGDDV